MKTFLVTFDYGDGIFGANMIGANTGNKELEAATETAERKAARNGYRVCSVRELTTWEVESNTRRGMPFYMIDDEAEEKYDLSMQDPVELLA